MTIQSVPSQPSVSYWTRLKNCCSDPATQQSAKMAICWTSAFGSCFIPVPYLNGALAGGWQFLGFHSSFQHPDLDCMARNERIVVSRTWKHIVAGTAIAAGGGSLIGLGNPYLMVLGMLVGLTSSIKVAYSDLLFQGDYRFLEQEDLLVEGNPSV